MQCLGTPETVEFQKVYMQLYTEMDFTWLEDTLPRQMESRGNHGLLKKLAFGEQVTGTDYLF